MGINWLEQRPRANAIMTKWGWQDKDTGEQLVSAPGYFEGRYEADSGDRPNQGVPLSGAGPEPLVAITKASGKPKITTQPADSNFTQSPGQVSFMISATIVDPIETDVLTYQWQVKLASESTYNNADSSVFAGTTTEALSSAIGLPENYIGARVRCIVSVGENTVTSTPATIVGDQ